MVRLPQSLLANTAWDFAQPGHANLIELEQVAAGLQWEAFGSLAHWHPWSPELGAPEIGVQLGVGRGSPRVVALRSVCPEGFTTLELLWALHRAVSSEVACLRRACLHSLTLESQPWSGQPPCYVLRLATVLQRPAWCGPCGCAV